MNILLVDDEENIQSIVSAFLNRYAELHEERLEIKSLSDPVQGLFEITSNGNHYDAILLDVRLPKLTGDEIYQSITHVNPELLDKVLFITGYREDLDARFPGKNLRVLDKPFRYAQLEMQLDDILKH
ncbi:MAG TPA: response regulator [Mariprofundaceae bacterium]|nr:response regulator [Mariprofundaceae bacterium]